MRFGIRRGGDRPDAALVAIRRTPSVAHFIDGIVTGKYQEPSKEETQALVDETVFKYPALTPLDSTQEQLLREYSTNSLERHAVSPMKISAFCGELFARGDTLYIPGDAEGREKILALMVNTDMSRSAHGR